jgi:hypothetical protein
MSVKLNIPVYAVKFNLQEYIDNQLLYPNVFDRAMQSEMYMDKTDKDGRYYLQSEYDSMRYFDIKDGDYIVYTGDHSVQVVRKKKYHKLYKQYEAGE